MKTVNKLLPVATMLLFCFSAVVSCIGMSLVSGEIYADAMMVLSAFAGLMALLSLVDKKASFTTAAFAIIAAFGEVADILNNMCYDFLYYSEGFSLTILLSYAVSVAVATGLLLSATYIIIALLKPNSFIKKLWFVPIVAFIAYFAVIISYFIV